MAATYADPSPCTTSTAEKSDARAYVGAMNAPVQPVSDRAPRARKPDWIRVKSPTSPGYAEPRKMMREPNLLTVCEEAALPNIVETSSAPLCSPATNPPLVVPILLEKKHQPIHHDSHPIPHVNTAHEM